MPGVVCVLTGADLADLDPYYGHAIKDRPIVAIDRVRFAGEPVAAVAAEDEATAEAALDAIEVEYEELPVVRHDRRGARPGGAARCTTGRCAPGLFHGLGELPPREGNVCYRYEIDRGEIEAVFAHADVVVEGDYPFPAVYQYAMETHTVIAQCGRRRDHGLGDLPAPVPRARRARRALRRAARARARRSSPTSAAASARSRTRRWSRSRSRSRARRAGPVRIVRTASTSRC